MDIEKIGIQGNLDANHLLYHMLRDDAEHWETVYDTMWPEQRKHAVMALCLMAKLNVLAQFDGDEKTATDSVHEQLREFVQVAEQMRLDRINAGLTHMPLRHSMDPAQAQCPPDCDEGHQYSGDCLLAPPAETPLTPAAPDTAEETA